MTPAEKTAAAAVVGSGLVSPNVNEGIISVLLGLSGVMLARQVFVGRERRRTGKKQPWQDTLPLTLCAMLASGVLIWDRKFGFSMSVFTGLGVGWCAILLLEIVGGWVLKKGQQLFGVSIEDIPHITGEQKDLLRDIDRKREEDPL